MKSWALIIVFAAVTSLSLHAQAETKKAPKRKVVSISFTEAELKQNRAPSSVEDQKEMAAEARHEARLAEANFTVPEM